MSALLLFALFSMQAPPAAASPAPTRDPSLPAAEETAKAALESSPRHGEYVDVKIDIAVAPDLVSGHGPGGGGTDSVASRDDVVKLVRESTPEETVYRLNAVRDYALKLPAANGKVATIGFCWGGGRSFAYAAAQPALNAAVVYYGTSPETPALAAVRAPVLGLYGGDDARVNATIGPAEAEMKKLGKTYEPHVYEGAGHGFLRQQTGRDGANAKATAQAWPRTVAFLHEHLGAARPRP